MNMNYGFLNNVLVHVVIHIKWFIYVHMVVDTTISPTFSIEMIFRVEICNGFTYLLLRGTFFLLGIYPTPTYHNFYISILNLCMYFSYMHLNLLYVIQMWPK